MYPNDPRALILENHLPFSSLFGFWYCALVVVALIRVPEFVSMRNGKIRMIRDQENSSAEADKRPVMIKSDD
jgi:hypothetical protein